MSHQAECCSTLNILLHLHTKAYLAGVTESQGELFGFLLISDRAHTVIYVVRASAKKSVDTIKALCEGKASECCGVSSKCGSKSHRMNKGG
jgi:hypothetical protein